MTRPANPRFPHWCRILRFAASQPTDDSPNVSDVDAGIIDKYFDDDVQPENEEHTGITVIYEGECRSFNRDTISDNGDVMASYRTLALPIRQDEWTGETMPLEGDRVEVQKCGYMEYGQVIDKRPGNLGTHILWKYNRN